MDGKIPLGAAYEMHLIRFVCEHDQRREEKQSGKRNRSFPDDSKIPYNAE
jgi:hypothetical protein